MGHGRSPLSWYQLEAAKVFHRQATRLDGLAPEKVDERLKKYGFNKLPEGHRVLCKGVAKGTRL